MDPLESVKITFFQECDEHLATLEGDLLAMEESAGDREAIDAVFRAVHSIKGGAGAFGLEALVSFAHVFETALDHMREGRLAVTHEAVQIMLRANDILADHVEAAKSGADADAAAAAAMMAELNALSPGEGGEAGGDDALDAGGTAPDELGFVPLKMDIADIGGDDTASDPAADDADWVVTFAPHARLYATANDALILLRELTRLGESDVSLDASALPGLDEIDPEGAYLSWTVRLLASCTEDDIREVFDFVDGDCTLTLERATGDGQGAGGSGDAADELPPADELGFRPVQIAIGEDDAITSPVAESDATPASAEPAASAAPQAASPPPTAKPAASPAASATIRVDLDRVDKLIDLVGELVINQAMLAQRVSETVIANDSNVSMGLDELEQLTREIQDSVMAIRAQPVRIVFQRMSRVARECASATGKQVRLVTEGEGTEVDKTVIERLSEPITHMLRNAVDHGLESPERRAEVGKPAEGVVRLSARHQSGRIVIDVADDGGGINRERVFNSAVEKGLVSADATLTDDEIDNLIMMPGFSTAQEVSNISGRGVGMDVVKRSIQELGGRLSISSEPGVGTTFSLSLPLTLAVLDGMVVSAGGQTLVAPLTSIVETLQPKADAVRRIGPNRTVLAVRGAHVPLVDVGVAMGWRTEPLPATEGVAILVDSEVHGEAALLVDGIQGQRQVVIKSLEANYQHVDCIAAATILGDGRVALIIDVESTIGSNLRGATPAEAKELLAAAG